MDEINNDFAAASKTDTVIRVQFCAFKVTKG
jgi:hypothetical protein